MKLKKLFEYLYFWKKCKNVFGKNIQYGLIIADIYSCFPDEKEIKLNGLDMTTATWIKMKVIERTSEKLYLDCGENKIN
jgi:hypothetical protein